LIAGVLGGMGPQATVDFFQEVIRRTPARRDQDHVHLLIDNNPGVPDRQAAMRGDVRAVCETLRRMATGLEQQGADFLVMPCNTAHAFVDDAIAAVRIPFVSIIDVSVREVMHRHPSAARVGLLATDACIASGNYQRAVAGRPLDIVVPDEGMQSACMALIADVKGGNTGTGIRARMRALAERFIERDLDVLIAGCTEIPLLLEEDDVDVPLVSSTDVLAARTVDYALRRLPLP